MITKELLKSAIDKVPDEYLEILYRILKAFEIPVGEPTTKDFENAGHAKKTKVLDWHQFIKETYGSLAEAPIQRGDQGKFEIREAME
ncbi:MAG: hypothetical protein ACW99Q_27820 [Candidatus Kariarchaeaceae archaeon]